MKENKGASRSFKDGNGTVRLSPKFVVISALVGVLAAFAVGYYGSHLAFQVIQKDEIDRGTQLDTSLGDCPASTNHDSDANKRWIDTPEGQMRCSRDAEVGVKVCRIDENGDEEQDGSEAQELIMDIKNVERKFLSSEDLLLEAMVKFTEECGLSLISYQCHGMSPSKKQCAGVSMNGHVSLSAWPSEGVISLNLIVLDSKSLLSFVPVAEKLFGVPPDGAATKPHAIWAQKVRGFSSMSVSGDSEASDLNYFPIGQLTEFKRNRVDVYDVIIPGQTLEDYEMSFQNDGSYHSTHADLFRPDRIVFLDGVMQSRRSGDAAYHEALVHPALFAHENPKRVAIIGGGEGATLREVLKHNTVEKVVMIEIDRGMVDLSRQHLPEWSDCGMLEGHDGSCFEGPRAELFCEDAFAWFIDRFGGEIRDERFDVIIMDALDPQVQIPFVASLYAGGPFLQSIPKALKETGIFVAQVGAAPELDDPPEDFTIDKNRANFFRSLENLGFQGIRDYEEDHGGFFSPWQFVVAFKDVKTQDRWFDSPASVDFKIRKRTIPNKQDATSLSYFDGATMTKYLYPSKSSELVFCTRSENFSSCKGGHGFDPLLQNKPISIIEEASPVRCSDRFDSKADAIPSVSYVGLQELVKVIGIPSDVYRVAASMDKTYGSGLWKRLAGQSWTFPKYQRFEAVVTPIFRHFHREGMALNSNETEHGTPVHSSAHATVYDPASERQPLFSLDELCFALRSYSSGKTQSQAPPAGMKR